MVITAAVAQATFFGFNMPFFGGPQKILSRQVDERLIKNDILQIIFTMPGERVYRPSFGTWLRGVIFETLDDAALGSLQSSMVTAITSVETRVNNVSVDLQLSVDRQTLSVRVGFSLVANPISQYLIDFNISPTGTISLTR